MFFFSSIFLYSHSGNKWVVMILLMRIIITEKNMVTFQKADGIHWIVLERVHWLQKLSIYLLFLSLSFSLVSSLGSKFIRGESESKAPWSSQTPTCTWGFYFSFSPNTHLWNKTKWEFMRWVNTLKSTRFSSLSPL